MGGIIPGIPIAYIAIRLGSLIILGSIPMLASILGSIPMLANIFGSSPILAITFGSMAAIAFGSRPMLAIILGSKPMLAIILGSIPAIDFAMFFGSIAADKDLASRPIDAKTFGSIPSNIFGSIPAAAKSLGSNPAVDPEFLEEDGFGCCCSICARSFGSIP